MDFHKTYDVAVAGAGIAGVAAALAAARRGHKTALIERQTLIGGLATSGLIFVYLPLCDGHGTQVTFGIAEELLRASIQYGPFELPARWGGTRDASYDRENLEGENPGIANRYQTCFAPAGFTLTLDKLLADAGVDLWLETLVCDVQMNDLRVTGLVVENVSGRGLVEAKCFVDATGAATIVRRAGGDFNMDLNYKTPWAMERSEDIKQYPFTEQLHLKSFNRRAPEFLAGSPLDGRSATDFSRSAWETLRNYYDAMYQNGTSPKNLYPVHLPAMAQFRKIASIKGLATIGDHQEWQESATSIGLYADWRKAGCVWETPYGTLLPEKVRGVLAAGRCMSVIGDAWEAYRVIPAAAMTGEAAGCAAALAVENHCGPAELKVEQVQNILRQNGFKFHFGEVGLSKQDQK